MTADINPGGDALPWHLLSTADPVDQATGSIITTVLGYGVTGVALLVLAVLYYKGWRLISPAREADLRTTAREEARTDILKELERITGEKKESDERANAATRFLVDQFVPLVSSFTDTTKALIPLLQEIIRHREGGGDLESRWRR